MIRIVSGTLRGRTLVVPRGRHTRPTSARVREALFDVLAHHPTHGVDLAEASVLDLFAGTGALGIEALSRGAREAVFVERAAPAARALRENLDRLGVAPRARVLQQDVSAALAALAHEIPFGLVLVDPPYAAERAFELFRKAWHPTAHLTPDGVLVLERAAGATVPEIPGLAPPGVRRWGHTEALFYRRAL